ncbi:hypothetical protein ES708_31344 [subsurface metagenome]
MPAYTPEMGFIVAGGGLLTFKTKRNNPYLYHSTLPLTLGIGTKGAFFTTAFLTSYWLDNRVRFYLDTWYRNMDDHYWGIGMDKGFDVEKGSQTTAYHHEGFKISSALLFKVVPNFYAGIKADFNNTKASDISELMLEDPHILEFGTNIFNSGLGFSLDYDSRDFPPNASEGLLLRLEGLFYNKTIGSDNDYQIFEFDYRQYLSIIREGSVLAWQLKTRLGFQNVPWTDMSKLGSMNDLRGYYWGQFRDNSMLFILMEYRHSFFDGGSMTFSRHGIVYWIGAGTVYDSTKDFNNGILNTGIGYRYELQPRMNLRIDVGFATESMGVYLSFTEAF